MIFWRLEAIKECFWFQLGGQDPRGGARPHGRECGSVELRGEGEETRPTDRRLGAFEKLRNVFSDGVPPPSIFPVIPKEFFFCEFH
jgi:hypothetical protein